MSKPTLTVTADFTDQLNDMVGKLKGDMVLVGIPAEKASRSDDNTINNATILAINEFGSPYNNIPARPVMKNGIKNATDAIANQFKLAAQALLDNASAVRTYYERAGIIASNSIKKAINDQAFEGGGPNNEKPADSTIKARKAKGFSGIKSLIVSGQLRNSITYIVRGD